MQWCAEGRGSSKLCLTYLGGPVLPVNDATSRKRQGEGQEDVGRSGDDGEDRKAGGWGHRTSVSSYCLVTGQGRVSCCSTLRQPQRHQRRRGTGRANDHRFPPRTFGPGCAGRDARPPCSLRSALRDRLQRAADAAGAQQGLGAQSPMHGFYDRSEPWR